MSSNLKIRFCLDAIVGLLVLALTAACTPTAPVDFLAGSGGEEFAHGQSSLAVPPRGTPLPQPGAAPVPTAASSVTSSPAIASPPASQPATQPVSPVSGPAASVANDSVRVEVLETGAESAVVQNAAQPAPVQAAPVREPPPAPASLSGSGAAGGFWIQAGVFSVEANVARARQQLQPIGAVDLTPVSLGNLPATRVMVGPFTSLSAAQSVLSSVRAAGYPDAWIQSGN